MLHPTAIGAFFESEDAHGKTASQTASAPLATGAVALRSATPAKPGAPAPRRPGAKAPPSASRMHTGNPGPRPRKAV